MRASLLAGAFLSLACMLPANSAAHAQGTGTSAEIRGRVTDPTGGTVPSAAPAWRPRHLCTEDAKGRNSR